MSGFILRISASIAHARTTWLPSFAHRAQRQQGQGMLEYALLLVLISIVAIVIIQLVGKSVNNVYSNINNGLGS